MSKIGFVIHGTKGGCNDLYATANLNHNDKSSISDVRAGSSDESAVGETCYAISFTENAKIFTKYRIVRDCIRDGKDVGFLGFYLIVPLDMFAEGKSIKFLLDSVMESYFQQYAPDNNLKALNENFDFVQKLLDKNEGLFSKKNNLQKSWMSASKELAYIFYDSTLIDMYFEDIYHEEYKNYRQVLLIDKIKKNTNNVLLVIRNTANISDKIDIINPTYIINIIASNSIQIDPNLQNKQVKINDKVKIDFRKKHYDSKLFEGTYKELVASQPEIFMVDDLSIPKKLIITPPKLEPIIKVIKLEIGDNNLYKDNLISKKCQLSGYSGEEKEIQDDFSIRFEGEEIGKQWELIIDGGSAFNVKKETIIPENILITKKIDLEKKKSVPDPSVGDNATRGVKHNHPKWWRNKNVFLLLTISIFLLLIGLSYYFRNGISQIFDDPTGPIIIETPLPVADSVIEKYCKGMDLNLDTLAYYQENMKKDSQISTKLMSARRVRKVINDCNIDSLNAISKIPGLSKDQNKLIKLLINNERFSREIDSKYDLSLDSISKIIKEMIAKNMQEEQSAVQENDVENNVKSNGGGEKLKSKSSPKVEKDTQKYDYDEKQFCSETVKIKKVTDVNNLKKKNLKKRQKNILELIEKDLKKFKNLDDRIKSSYAGIENELGNP